MKEVYNKLLTFKANDKIDNTLSYKADKANMNKSEFIRAMIMSGRVVVNSDDRDCTRLMGLVGSSIGNINQISHNLNIASKQNSLSDEDFDNLNDLLVEIRNELRDLS